MALILADNKDGSYQADNGTPVGIRVAAAGLNPSDINAFNAGNPSPELEQQAAKQQLSTMGLPLNEPIPRDPLLPQSVNPQLSPSILETAGNIGQKVIVDPLNAGARAVNYITGGIPEYAAKGVNAIGQGIGNVAGTVGAGILNYGKGIYDVASGNQPTPLISSTPDKSVSEMLKEPSSILPTPDQASKEAGAVGQVPSKSPAPAALGISAPTGANTAYDKFLNDLMDTEKTKANLVSGYREAANEMIQHREKIDADEEKASKDKLDKMNKEYTDQVDSMSKSGIKDFWADKSVFSKILAAVMTGLGEVGRGLTGGTVNPAQQIIQATIDNDYRVQKSNLDLKKDEINNKYNLLNFVRTQVKDEQDQHQYYRSIKMQDIANGLDAMSEKFKGTEIAAKLGMEAATWHNNAALVKADIMYKEAQAAALMAKTAGGTKLDKAGQAFMVTYDNVDRAINALQALYKKYPRGLVNVVPGDRSLIKQAAAMITLNAPQLYGFKRFSTALSDHMKEVMGDPLALTHDKVEELSNFHAYIKGTKRAVETYGTAQSSGSEAGQSEGHEEIE